MGTDAKNNPFTTTYDFSKGFAIGGYLDAQPMATGTAYERAAYGNYVFGAYMSAGGWPTLSLPPNPPRLPHPSRLSKGGNANPNARRRYAVSIQ